MTESERNKKLRSESKLSSDLAVSIWRCPSCKQQPKPESSNLLVMWPCGVMHDLDGYLGVCEKTGNSYA